MTTIDKYKNEIIVWSVITAVFTVLSIFAFNFDRLRSTAQVKNLPATEAVSEPGFFQPGHSVVLMQ